MLNLRDNAPILEVQLPVAPTVNHMYYHAAKSGSYHSGLTGKAKSWFEAAQWVVKQAVRIQEWPYAGGKDKIVVEFWNRWPDDGHKHDMHNQHKIVMDMLEGIVYNNDQYALARDMDFDTASSKSKSASWLKLRIYYLGDEVEP